MFFSSILWCSQSGNHLDENLAKFGYNPNMKISLRKEIFLYSRLPTRTIKYENLAIWIFFPPNVVNLGNFFSWKILCTRLKVHVLSFSILGCGDNWQKNSAKFDYKPNIWMESSQYFPWYSISSLYLFVS